MEAVAPTDWNTTRKARLEELYRDGVSFSIIADDIGVTRNAAIGKAHRMHLPKRKSTVVTKNRKPSTTSPSLRRRRRKAVAAMKKAAQDFVCEPGRDYRVTIEKLQDRTCRYPLWGVHGARLYCGVPDASLVAGSPYCRKHAKMCGVPSMPKKYS